MITTFNRKKMFGFPAFLRSFTLIEMMVVMIIMAILFSIALPALMKVQAASGVEHSARRLQAVLMNARALALRNQANYSVCFGTWCYDVDLASGAVIHTNNRELDSELEVDNSYAVFGHSLDGSFPWVEPSAYRHNWKFSTLYSVNDLVRVPETGRLYRCNIAGTSANTGSYPTWGGKSVTDGSVTWNLDSTTASSYERHIIDKYQVGKTYHLDDGTKFFALTYKGANGHTWDALNPAGGDAKYDRYTWHGADSSGNYVGYMPVQGGFRITYNAAGEASFHWPHKSAPDFKYESAGDVWQVIVICKDDDPEKRLQVRVNKYSGEVKIMH